MKFAADDYHREFFQKNKLIEFENVLDEQETAIVQHAIRAALSKRLIVRQDQIEGTNVQKIFESGRDLWRESDPIRKLVLDRRFGELASQLVGLRPIRMGYDQYFPALNSASKFFKGKYEQFLQTPSTLREMSSLQGVVCGILFRFHDQVNTHIQNVPNVFPSKKGNLVFIHPDYPVSWPDFLDSNQKDCYLVVYVSGTTLYVINSKDPQSRFLMREGYSSGDRLNDMSNPTIFR